MSDLTATTRQTEEYRRKGRLIIIVSVVGTLMLAWSNNVFDNFLWRVHLNHSTCVQNLFGATFCGDAAERYQQKIKELTKP